MEIQIENLKAKMRGKKLNHYQEGLALDEFEKLIAHTETLEQQLRQYNVVGRSEQLKCGNSNPPCSPNIKFGCLECTECNWSE